MSDTETTGTVVTWAKNSDCPACGAPIYAPVEVNPTATGLAMATVTTPAGTFATDAVTIRGCPPGCVFSSAARTPAMRRGPRGLAR